ncbi:MAG: DUF1993 domain-containing protein, partial [Gammaproteobacteria bacterium]
KGSFMSNPYYEQVVGGFSHAMRASSAILDKAKVHADANKFDLANILASRLFPDMFACTRQFQIATDIAKGAAARLTGSEPPKWDDSETIVEQIQARIGKALDYLASFSPNQFEGAATRAIEVKTPAGDFRFTGQTFLVQWAVPNFYFHCATAYNLLRHAGVPIGKVDFLGKL